MAKLHELLAAERTPNAAWGEVAAGTLKKFGNPEHFYNGHSKSLKMIEESPANSAIEDQSREEKPVTTTVYETLEYALDIFGRAEDLQYQKNETNRNATGTIQWKGAPLIENLPVDELLGLEARLAKIREILAVMPTLDATKHWDKAPNQGDYIWALTYPEETTKTEKVVVPVVMAPATEKHPAQIQPVTKDVTVGKFTLIRRSGAATAHQKAEVMKRIDDLIVEVKQARMRANEAEAVKGTIAQKLIDLILEPLKA